MNSKKGIDILIILFCTMANAVHGQNQPSEIPVWNQSIENSIPSDWLIIPSKQKAGILEVYPDKTYVCIDFPRWRCWYCWAVVSQKPDSIKGTSDPPSGNRTTCLRQADTRARQYLVFLKTHLTISGRLFPMFVACSNANPICRTLKSALCLPTIWIPMGNPVFENAQGTDSAGFPTTEM